MPRVVGLFRSPRPNAEMEAVREVEAVKEVGFAGCAHARPGGQRQVLLMNRETLVALNLSPDIIWENITTEGLSVNALKEGESLRIGEAWLRVTMVSTPCGEMDELRAGLRKEIRGRRGMLCKVVKGGIIRQGDAIEKLD
jgi:MOSC domain-containing protein YiiM